MDFSKNGQVPNWKEQVRQHFSQVTLSASEQDNLEKELLGARETPLLQARSVVRPFGDLRQSLAWAQRWGLGYVATAAAAASLTFAVTSRENDDIPDPIAEITSLPGPRYYPPDFDLEGDATALQDILKEVFAEQEIFVANIPKQISAKYAPSEGRFFSWDGEPAVSIQLNTLQKLPNSTLNPPATLYIVKLSDKSDRRFPRDKVTKKVASKSGKSSKNVNMWREGKYGYAMVQSVAVAE